MNFIEVCKTCGSRRINNIRSQRTGEKRKHEDDEGEKILLPTDIPWNLFSDCVRSQGAHSILGVRFG